MNKEKQQQQQTLDTPLTRRTLAKIGAGAFIAAAGLSRMPRAYEVAAAAETTGETLESNAFLFAGHEAVDPNILTDKSPEEQADIVTIHDQMTEAESAARVAMDRLGLIFNSGNTTENMERVQQSPGAYLPHNATEFAELKKYLFGPDYHELLIESGIDIAEVNRALEAIDNFKSQTDTRFAAGVMDSGTPNTGSVPEFISAETVEDMPRVFDNSLMVGMRAVFTSSRFDMAGKTELNTKKYNVGAILELMYDDEIAQTRVLPRGFEFAVAEDK